MIRALCCLILAILFVIPSMSQTNETYYTRVFHSCKAWGLMKYFHSEIRGGDVNWDDEFLALIRQAKTQTDQAFDTSLYHMLTLPGESQYPDEEAPVIHDTLKIFKDTTWIYDDFYSDSVSNLLDTLLHTFRPKWYVNSYVRGYLGRMPNLRNDSLYYRSVSEYPDEEFRILGLARFWNAIEYFYPYKDVLDQDWDISLKEVIPMVVNAQNALEYGLAIKQITKRISDTHATHIGSRAYWEYAGLNHPPFLLKYVEEQTVVTQVTPQAGDLKVGDLLLEVDGIPVEVLRDSFAQIASGSNQAVIEREINDFILYGDEGPVTIKATDGDTESEYTYFRSRTVLDTLYPAEGTPYYTAVIGNDTKVGVIDIRFISSRHLIFNMFHDNQDWDAIIFDIRGYPAFAASDVIHYLFEEDTVQWGIFKGPDPIHPGTVEVYEALVYPQRDEFDPLFTGPLMILFDENTQSYAEQMCMILEQYHNTIKVGSTTAGADGTVSYLFLPGRISTVFTGLGVFYPDFTPTQRVGIIPDYYVTPTIKGLRNGQDEVLDFALNLLIADIPATSVQNEILIYPNPADRYVNIKSNQIDYPSINNLSLIDIQGRELLKYKNLELPYTLSVTSVPNGVYFLRMEYEGQVTHAKIFIK